MGGGARVAAGEYEIRLLPAAAQEFRRLQGSVRERVEAAIDGLGGSPRPVGCVELAGRDDFRIRIGDYRVVDAVDDAERLVIVARIAHRREIYRRA